MFVYREIVGIREIKFRRGVGRADFIILCLPVYFGNNTREYSFNIDLQSSRLERSTYTRINVIEHFDYTKEINFYLFTCCCFTLFRRFQIKRILKIVSK